MSIIEEAVRKNAERNKRQPAGTDPAREPGAPATRADGACRYLAYAALPADHAGQSCAARRDGAAAAPGRGRLARLQDPAYARPAPPGSEPVALLRAHRRDRGRGQDAHGDQPRDRAVAGPEHLGRADRPGPAAAARRRVPRHAQHARREGPERLSAGQRQLREHRVCAGHRAAARDPEFHADASIRPRCWVRSACWS